MFKVWVEIAKIAIFLLNSTTFRHLNSHDFLAALYTGLSGVSVTLEGLSRPLAFGLFDAVIE